LEKEFLYIIVTEREKEGREGGGRALSILKTKEGGGGGELDLMG